ncbi:fumarylacetoacetate hydrolase family protein [Nitratireductor pacificus]|uniref:Isomerase/hydrolase n=1 Tax=Nitratireductor pacificus pht-3B TaxID=391937 RepID=K2N663_9HYPH|nr:fumarylacetoacetate hydrolase family protein [Nitratireductor pacificus]EKF19623.1 isomerase/hydrolase [Nitratireductor pacificus pht-3B]
MAEFAFPPAPQPSVAIAGSPDRFPVRRIFCVGRNYAAHAREMGADPNREPPFFFTKPADSVVGDGATVPYPALTEDLHHEIELVVAIGTGGRNIANADALGHVFGYAAGIDLTRRDLQGEAKKTGRPWDWGKAFDNSAPCGAVAPVGVTGHPASGGVWLKVNDEIRQQGDLAELIWPVADVIAICSRAMELKAGDLIYTGTPAGVGAVKAGDRLSGGIDGVGTISITIIGARLAG